VLKATIHRLGRWYLGQILNSEAESQKPRAINERPIELAFLFQALSDLRPARVLDVGPGMSALPAVLHGVAAMLPRSTTYPIIGRAVCSTGIGT
jgi:hypothetical protein